LKKYKVETHPDLLDEGYDKEEFEWSVDEIVEEINRDRSPEWSDYDETDFEEGWREWCEGNWYTIKELIDGYERTPRGWQHTITIKKEETIND